MEASDLVLVAMVLGLALWAFLSGGTAKLEESGRETVSILSTSWMRLLLGFTLAGLITVMVPSELIGRYLGEGSGISGLIIATVAGILTPGGPFIQFPIVASLYRAGAAPGPLAAYLTAWGTIPLNRSLVWEVPFLGIPFTVARLAVSLAAPFLIGLAVPYVLRLTQR